MAVDLIIFGDGSFQCGDCADFYGSEPTWEEAVSVSLDHYHLYHPRAVATLIKMGEPTYAN